MMKKMSILLLVLNSSLLFSETIRFECKLKDVPGVHKFEAKGLVVVNDHNELNGIISIETKKSQEEQSIQIFDQLNVSGVYKYYGPGSVTVDGFSQLALKIENTYIKNIFINLDVSIPMASYANSVDYFLYRSDCKTIKENN